MSVYQKANGPRQTNLYNRIIYDLEKTILIFHDLKALSSHQASNNIHSAPNTTLHKKHFSCNFVPTVAPLSSTLVIVSMLANLLETLSVANALENVTNVNIRSECCSIEL